MAKKTVIDSKLLETIDDHIYKHLPIHKITEMVDKRVEELSSKILSDVNDKINGTLLRIDGLLYVYFFFLF